MSRQQNQRLQSRHHPLTDTAYPLYGTFQRHLKHFYLRDAITSTWQHTQFGNGGTACISCSGVLACYEQKRSEAAPFGYCIILSLFHCCVVLCVSLFGRNYSNNNAIHIGCRAAKARRPVVRGTTSADDVHGVDDAQHLHGVAHGGAVHQVSRRLHLHHARHPPALRAARPRHLLHKRHI